MSTGLREVVHVNKTTRSRFKGMKKPARESDHVKEFTRTFPHGRKRSLCENPNAKMST